VARAFVVCGSARTAPHNKVFLSGLPRTLEAAPEHLGKGRFASEPLASLRAFGHIYAGWGLSQDFYRAALYRTALSAPDLETFVRTDWEERFAARRAANLYAKRWPGITPTSQMIRATAATSRGRWRHLYFRVADNEAELAHLRDRALRPSRAFGRIGRATRAPMRKTPHSLLG